MNNAATAKPGQLRVDFFVMGILALTVAVAHYFFFREFGLYEDDYAHIATLLGAGWDTIYGIIRWALITMPDGRPIQFAIIPIITYLVPPLGGFSALYLVGWAIVSANAVLIFFLLRRFGAPLFALCGALVFALYPADTTRAFLTHALSYQVSVTFLLLASLAYLNGFRPLAYILIIGSLFSFEACFLPFLLVPLLQVPWDRKRGREMVFHLSICVALIVGDFLLRRSMGEHRVFAELPPPLTLALKIPSAMVLGPRTSLYLGLYRIVTTLRALDLSTAIVIVLASLVFFFAFWILSRQNVARNDALLAESPRARRFISARLYASDTLARFGLRLPLVGLLMLIVSYAFSFTHYPPTFWAGRLTSVHLTASVGAAILYGWFASVFVSWAGTKWAFATIALVALCLGVWVGAGWLVQQDFRFAWQQERIFWSQVLKLTPDMDDNTLVFVVADTLPKVNYILIHSFGDSFVLNSIYGLHGRERQGSTRLFFVGPDWTDSGISDGDGFIFPVRTIGDYYVGNDEIKSGGLIVLQQQGNTLVRESGTVNINGHPFALKPSSGTAHAPIVNQMLYQLLSNTTY